MEITKVAYFSTRDEWRTWLMHHYKTEPDIWVQFYKKATGKIGVSYNDAVEEALCFGWIDSIVKSYTTESYIQRFSQRKSTTPYSESNKDRLKKLIADKKVLPEILATLHERANGK